MAQRRRAVADRGRDCRGQEDCQDSAPRERQQAGEQNDAQRQTEEIDRAVCAEVRLAFRVRNSHRGARDGRTTGGPAPAAHGVLEPPDQRTNPQSQELGEMIAIAETPFGALASSREGVFVEPEELAVAGQELHNAERRHDQGRERTPTQQSLDVLDAPDALDGDKEQEREVEEEHQPAARFGGRERQIGPVSKPAGSSSVGVPQRQEPGGVGRNRPSSHGGNGTIWRTTIATASRISGVATAGRQRASSQRHWRAAQAQAVVTASTVSASWPIGCRPPINIGTRKTTPPRPKSTNCSNISSRACLELRCMAISPCPRATLRTQAWWRQSRSCRPFGSRPERPLRPFVPPKWCRRGPGRCCPARFSRLEC